MTALARCLVLLVATGAMMLTPVTARAATVVSLTFDDGVSDQRPAADALSARGMKGTFYVNTGRVGADEHLGWSDLAQMAAAGHEIGGHTVLHQRLTSIAADEARREICHDRENLVSRGFGAASFAYPNGSYDDAVQEIVAQCGYASARSTRGLSEFAGEHPAEALPLDLDSHYAIRTPPDVDVNTTDAMLRSYVTAAEAAGGGWVNLVFHHVCDAACDPFSISTARFASFLDWLAARSASGTVVRTVAEVVGRAPAPTVPAPPWPVPPEGANALSNPSFESVDGGGSPACVTLDGWGTSSASYSRTGDAHSGARAQRLIVTGYADGDRKISVRRDLGACSASVSAGRTYRLSAAYKGSAPVQLVAFARDASGRWDVYDVSPTMPASATWSQAVWEPPTIPSGIRGLALSVALKQNGTIVVDDLSVDDTTIAPPSSAITCDGAACPDTPMPGPVDVALSATDLGSGLDGILLTRDGTSPLTAGPRYDRPFQVAETTTLRWRAVDRAGNLEAPREHVVRIAVPGPSHPPAPTPTPTARAPQPPGPPAPDQPELSPRVPGLPLPARPQRRIELRRPWTPRAQNHRVSIPLRCVAAGDACQGRLTLTALPAGKVARRTSLGAAPVNVRAGRGTTVRVMLTREARRLLAAHRRLRVEVKLRLNGSSTYDVSHRTTLALARKRHASL